MDKKKVRNKEKERSHKSASKGNDGKQIESKKKVSNDNVTKQNASKNEKKMNKNGKTQTPDTFHHQFLKSLCVEDRSGADDSLFPNKMVSKPVMPRLQIEPLVIPANKQTQTEILCDDKGVQVQLRDYEMDLAVALTAGHNARLDQNNNGFHAERSHLRNKPNPHASTQTNLPKTTNVETETLIPVSIEKSAQTSEVFLKMDKLQTSMNNLLTMIIDQTQNGCSRTSQKDKPDFTDLAVSYSDFNKLIISMTMELNRPSKNNTENSSDELKELMNWIDSAPPKITKELKQTLRGSILLKLKAAEAQENSSVQIEEQDDVSDDDDDAIPSAAVPTSHVPARLPPVRPPGRTFTAPAPPKMPHYTVKNSREPVVNSTRLEQLLMPPPPSPAVITVPTPRVSQVRKPEEAPRSAPMMKLTKKNLVTAEDIAQLKKAKQNSNNEMQNGHLYQSCNARNRWGQEVSNPNVNRPPPPPRDPQHQVRQAPVAQRHHPYYTNAAQMQMGQQMEQAQPPQQMRYTQPQQPAHSAAPYLHTYQRQGQPPNFYRDCSMPVPGNNEQMEQMPNYSASYPNTQWGLYYPQ